MISAPNAVRHSFFANLRKTHTVELTDVSIEVAHLEQSPDDGDDDISFEQKQVAVSEGARPSGGAFDEMPRLVFVRELDLERLPDGDGGYVEVELLIAPDGIVVMVTPISTNLPSAYFSEIERAFLDAIFTPAIRSGRNVFAKVRFRAFFGRGDEGSGIESRRLGSGSP